MNIKWIFIDIDGTLIDSDFQISMRNKKAVGDAIKKGVKVTIASGRMCRSVIKIGNQLGILEDDLPLISYQGALISTSLTKQTLSEYSLDLKTAIELIQFAKEQKITCHAYLDDILCVDHINKRVSEYCQHSMVPVKAVGDLSKYIYKPPYKILFSGEPDMLDKLWLQFNKQYGDTIYVTKSKPMYLEFLNPLANKGQALEFLIRSQGINKEETMAIGDSFNDLKFFKSSGLKVAMGNAVPELKEAADFISQDCDHDGVAVAIEKFVL